ncbi:MAG TPA: YcaO-like family protein [Polyangiaceae bacterium]|nr:YcaO-like family protein [Polyangiaceae bacterium]
MKALRSSDVAALASRFGAPPSLGAVEWCVDDAKIDGATIHLAGVAADVDGECVTGSAASTVEVPIERAYLELLERLAVLEAIERAPSRFATVDETGTTTGIAPFGKVFPTSPTPDTWRWARSNGVAVGPNFGFAANRAHLELIERDRVLRSWYGELLPRSADVEPGLFPAALREHYHVRANTFGDSEGGVVCGVFALPKGGAPLSFGFSARPTAREAVASAALECLQRIGFLFGEACVDEEPEAAPTPDFHQDYFLAPDGNRRIERWLAGNHQGLHGFATERARNSRRSYVDLTPDWFRSGLSAVRAIPDGELPLWFGASHPLVDGAHLSSISVHPIA